MQNFEVFCVVLQLDELIETVRAGEISIFIYFQLRDCIRRLEQLGATDQRTYRQALLNIVGIEIILGLGGFY